MITFFYIFTGAFLLFILFSILRSNSNTDKSALLFIKEVSHIIEGEVLERRIVDYKLSISGSYKGKKIQCKYIRSGGEAREFPIIQFELKPFSIPKIKRNFFNRQTKITDEVILKNGVLIYKHVLSSHLFSVNELFDKIFDRLVQAEECLQQKKE